MNAPLNPQLLHNPVPIKTKYLNYKHRYMTAAADNDFNALKAKYKKFNNHSDIYNASIGAFMSIGRAFSSLELSPPYGPKPFYTNPLVAFLQETVRPGNELNRFISLEKDWVETRLKTKDLTISLNFKSPDRVSAAEAIIKQFFLDFRLPTEFKGADLEGKGNLGRFSLGPEMSTILSVEALSKMIPNYTPPGGDVSSDAREKNRFKLPRGYKDAGYNKIAYVKVTLHQDRAVLRDSEDQTVRFQSTGNLAQGRMEALIDVSFELIYRWPWAYAQYATCANTREEFIPFLFYQYVNWHRIAYAGKRTRGGGLSIKPPARVNHLGNIAKQIEAEKKAGRIVIPRLNEDGFVIIGTGEPSKLGQVIWIDKTVNRISEYMDQIRSSFNADDKRIDLSKLKIKGTGLFFDAHNEKFVYVREAGSDNSASDVSGIQTLDLTGSIALDDITIAKWLNKKVAQDANSIKDLCTLIYDVLGGEYPDIKLSRQYLAADLKEFGFNEFDAKQGRSIFPSCAQTIVESPDINTTWAALGGGRKLSIWSPNGEDITEGTEEAAKFSRLQKVRAFGNALTAISRDLLNNFDSIEIAYSKKIESLRFLLTLVSKYAKGDVSYQNTLRTASTNNELRHFTKDEVLNMEGKVNLANLPGITKFMPHQSETVQDLHDDTTTAFIEIVVGGGKGMVGPVDACNLMQTKKVRRPLMLVPGHLVKNWANEIQKFSQGRVNTFILTIQNVRRLQQVYLGDTGLASKPNYVFLKKIIEACPPNTIFISNFRFPSIDKEEIVYANSVITRFYSAEFLREMQFDLVTIDESHGVKTLGSNQTKGASIVSSVAKYKRLMSGTLINNTLLDLVGQSAISNPSALGTESNFIRSYGAGYSDDDGDGKLVAGEWRPDAASLIIQDMRPYTKRIIHKRNRIAFMLPEAIENFHPVMMTDKQKEFYEAMLSNVFDDLRAKNPKLFTKLIDGNESDDGAIASGLATHFQAVEQFLCAPDSVEEFMQLEDLTDEDKKSPKINKVVELLDEHFQGYVNSDGSKEAADEYKVIIFGNRKVTSEHVFKWLPEKYRKMAVHYTADNKQAAEIFERNPKIRILVADGASITSGLNLQFAARMIRMETVWSPGDLEQAFARIWRPDFGGKGADRVKVYLDWMVCNYSLDVAKTGRIISKLVEKIKYDRQEDPNFVSKFFVPSDAFKTLKVGDRLMTDIIDQVNRPQPIEKMLNTLPLIKMNNETLRDLQEMGQLEQYFATYALTNDFEIQEFNREKAEGLQELIPIPDSVRTEIEGSKELAYKPRVPGSNPEVYDPNNHFGYKPISIIESEAELNALEEEDEDSEKPETYKQVEEISGGELVSTEFGIGRITNILQNEVWVNIKGLGNVRVPKATTWLITNPIAITGIEKTLARGTIVYNPPGISSHSTDVYRYDKFGAPEGVVYDSEDVQERPKVKVRLNTTTKVAPPPVVMPTAPDGAPKKTLVRFKDNRQKAPEVEKAEMELKAPPAPKKPRYDVFDDVDEDVVNEIEIYAEIIDGQVALTCKADDQDSDVLTQDHEFRNFPKYYAVEVKNEGGLDSLLETLSSKFTVRDEYIDNFDLYKKLIASKKLAVSTPADFKDTLLFFKAAQKPIKEGVIRPFPIVWGDSLFVAIDYAKTPSVRKASQEIRKANISGIRIAGIQENVHLRFFKSADEAIEELEAISETLTVTNLDETVAYLKSIVKKAPTNTVKKTLVKITPKKLETPPTVVKTRTKAEPVAAPKKTLVRFKR